MFLSSLRRWFTDTRQPSQTPAKVGARRGFKPRLETLEERIVPAWSVSDLTTTTAAAMVQNLVGAGVAVNSIQYKGAKIASGTFTDSSNVIGIAGGIILSSGSAKGIAGPNASGSFSTSTGAASDPDLDKIIALQAGYDASVLEFNFVPQGNILSFSYVFGSDEYPEFVNSINDAFGFFLNGKNVAIIPGSTLPVSINNVNDSLNSQFYVDNDTVPTAHDTQMNGYTTVLSVVVPVNPGQSYHIKLAIEDAADSTYDSWVIIKSGSLSTAGHAYAPPRYTYNPVTKLYFGYLTVVNYSTVGLTGPLYLFFQSLPKGVKVTNATGKSSKGVPYFTLAKGIAAQTSIHLPIYLTNPYHLNLGTFFSHYKIGLTPIKPV
ncbi:MAG: hypothetical protein EXR98_13510 [Gemmataceae bacterium]|nr:hypothetical protein [Gemmataceae bacterium]